MMKRAVVIALLACWAASALSLARDEKKSIPSATVSSANEFNPSAPPSTTLKPTTTTTTPKPTTTTTPKPTTTTTTPKPTTTTTTPKPTTTTTTPKPTTTTTTPKPTTTTTTPKPTTTTTTPKPTTTTTTPKPTTTTTTPKPTTTTTPKPTTKSTTTPSPPQPTPPTKLDVGNYTLMTDQKVICLMAHMALQIRMEPKASGPFIVQPNMTKVEGGCQLTTANLTLVFKEGQITFMFNKSTADNTVYVDALSFVISYPLSKENKIPYTANNKSLHLFAATIGRSYSCKAESLYMGNGLYLDVNQDTMQAFNLTNGNQFGNPDRCPADQPDYRVAIAVGVTLLVLIIIVVVAYLLGRRRRTDGYQSL